ncbi:NapC/NirT family cytochrome c [Anaeromyxobacter terrae]|uniref:NapC/NirT family cytochrome c n=1 Tax=Anaeromyxobacter terrae TaxID=2925406 RepID=UPI001F57922A|nr:NapC/NirT family cytochrome c [Anaeromyxobacter sp. SG22]
MKILTAALVSLVLAGSAARAQAPAPTGPASAAPAAPPIAPAAPAITPSKDFPKGTATPSADCGACHQAIYREYAEGFGSDMRYPGVRLRSKDDKVLEMPAGSSVAASAHAVSGTDPWPIHAREAEEEGKKCNVCHFPQPFAIPERTALEVVKPAPRAEAQGEGITCASCHLTPEGKIRGPHKADAPHETVADERMSSSEMCAFCHSLGKRVPGKQTQTYLEWRDDFAAPGLGRQQCQDCHMPRTQRKTAEDADVPLRAVARHLWTGGHSGQRLGSALSLVMLQPQKDGANVELHLINVGAGHSVPTGSNRRAIYLQTRAVDRKGKVLATREWMFAPWYGPRPDDRTFLEEDKKRPDHIAATQADEQGLHEAPIRAGEERVLTWQPALRDGSYTVEASLIYDLNRYNDRASKGDQREISRFTLPFQVKASH